jgi:hypothetical protein
MVKECIDRLILYNNDIEWMKNFVIRLQKFRQQNDSIMVISFNVVQIKKKNIFKTLNDGVILIQY